MGEITGPSTAIPLDEVEEQADMIGSIMIHLNLIHLNQVLSMRLMSL